MHHALLHTAAFAAARGASPAQRAAAEECCQVLLEAGADAGALDGCGLTALQWHLMEVRERCAGGAGHGWWYTTDECSPRGDAAAAVCLSGPSLDRPRLAMCWPRCRKRTCHRC
jgi:hypothetical protein